MPKREFCTNYILQFSPPLANKFLVQIEKSLFCLSYISSDSTPKIRNNKKHTVHTYVISVNYLKKSNIYHWLKIIQLQTDWRYRRYVTRRIHILNCYNGKVIFIFNMQSFCTIELANNFLPLLS